MAEMDYVRDHPKTPVQPPKQPFLSPLTDTTKKNRDAKVAAPSNPPNPSFNPAPIFEMKANHEEGSLYVPPSDLACLTAPKQPCIEGHRPLALPKFEDVQTCMWTASHAANCPSEDRSASLVNVLLQPMPPGLDSETQLPPLEEPDYSTLIRINLWCVVDGHGGGCVASYVSEVLLPHIAASVSRALGCAILERGVCIVNGQRRDANALDFDGLIKTTSDRNVAANPNSIRYRSPFERSDSEEEGQHRRRLSANGQPVRPAGDDVSAVLSPTDGGHAASEADSRPGHKSPREMTEGESVEQASSCKTSVKTAASPATREELVGTHSPKEVASITRAITESFLAVDEGWINSIDPVATHQTSCQSNGRWNSGACALVVFTIQRLDWTNVFEPGREREPRDPEKSRLNTCQNRDAARRRMLDYARRAKSDGTMSTGSSTSSLTTEEAVHASGIESEITETEGEEDYVRTSGVDTRNRNRDADQASLRSSQGNRESFISPPGACSCHSYRAQDAMIYTAHVGDCRAVMLGSAPPRTIKVGDYVKGETDDESSHHSSDETECLSSSDHDADTSEDEDVDGHRKRAEKTDEASKFINLPPRRVARVKGSRPSRHETDGPFIALPPWHGSEAKLIEVARKESRDQQRNGPDKDGSDASSTSSQDSIDLLPLLQLQPSTGPIDLTTDHSAYNPAEVTAVLRRCNNAPRAISSGMGGGIKRVAGSLAVTRALGDAYLKTPLLSFNPYKRHAPYITARPEVNCRPLVKNGDKVLILATDGVWERASGEDVLRWVRNFYEERIAEAERRRIKRLNQQVDKNPSSSNEEGAGATADQSQSKTAPSSNTASKSAANQEGSERDLFEKNEPDEKSGSRKRETTASPVGLPSAKRRKRNRPNRISYNVADVIVRRVLNKVRRARNITSLQALMSLPQGRARRSKVNFDTCATVSVVSHTFFPP